MAAVVQSEAAVSEQEQRLVVLEQVAAADLESPPIAAAAPGIVADSAAVGTASAEALELAAVVVAAAAALVVEPAVASRAELAASSWFSSQYSLPVAVDVASVSSRHYTHQTTWQIGRETLLIASPFAVASSTTLVEHSASVAATDVH